MRPRAAFDLRKIGLADGPLHLPGDGAHHFLLRHFAVQAAERSFDQAQIPDFFAGMLASILQSHITYRNPRYEVKTKRKPGASPASYKLIVKRKTTGATDTRRPANLPAATPGR